MMLMLMMLHLDIAILQPEDMRAFMEDDSKYMMLDAPHAVDGLERHVVEQGSGRQ